MHLSRFRETIESHTSLDFVSRGNSPSALAIEPSGDFDGDDGPWSTFAFQVGNPAQVVKLLIATSGQETWVVVPHACESSSKIATACRALRGGVFAPSQSTTWAKNNFFQLDDESNLGYHGIGEYGFDTVAPGFTGGIPLKHQIVAGIITTDFYLGLFGLSDRPTNFSSYRDPQQSFLSSLRRASRIPSLSYGYTAGAKYRLGGVQGSLTLGGYDASRFVPNNVTFDFHPVTYRDIVVGIRSVSTSSGDKQQPNVYAMIDGATPHIWLPADTCAIFEKAFGITLDPDTGLYLVSETQHHDMMSQNTTVTFELAADLKTGASVGITLPYASFDLELTRAYPGVSNGSRYFPLRRAKGSDQYTLGRTFLQEAYLTVDYERGNFSISQSAFGVDLNQNLVDIISPTDVPSPSTSPTTGISDSPNAPTGAIVGAVVGSVVLIILVAAAWFIWRRRSYQPSGHTENKEGALELDAEGTAELRGDAQKPEVDGVVVQEAEGQNRWEMGHDLTRFEADATPIHAELHCHPAAVEMEADLKSDKQLPRGPSEKMRSPVRYELPG